MEFTAAKKDFTAALAKAQGVPEQKNLTTALAHVHLKAEGSNAVRLTAQCYEVTVSITFPAEVTQPGDLALSGRSLFDAARMLPEAPILLQSLENDWARLAAGRTDYKIPGMSPQHLPDRKVPKATDSIRFPVSHLLEMVDRVGFAVSTDEGRPNLNGVFVAVEPAGHEVQVEMVATDGHRLARLIRRMALSGAVAKPLGVILHRRGIQELRRFLADEEGDVAVGFQRNAAAFEIPSGYLLVNQIELEYPDYHRVLPTSFRWRVCVSRSDFIRAVQRASVMLSGEKGPLVRLSLKPGRLQTFAQDASRGDAQDEVDVDYDGDPLEIAFNHRYLLEALAALPGDTVTFSVKDLGSAASLTSPADEGLLQLIMPIRS